MPRKTIKIEDLKAEINRLLSLDNTNVDQQKILCYLLEKFLMETGNYRGFSYNDLRTEKCDQWKKDYVIESGGSVYIDIDRLIAQITTVDQLKSVLIDYEVLA